MCVNCYGYICDRCVADVVPAINSKRKRYHEHCTACVEGLNYFNDNGKQPVDYIAPCCLLRVNRPPKLVFDNKRKNLGDRITSSPLGGSFVIPEFRLIVSTCFDSIDVLGLGREDNLNPRIHFVNDEQNGLDLQAAGVVPLTEMPESWEIETTIMHIRLPHVGKKARQRKKVFNVVVYYAPKSRDMPNFDKGCNELSPGEAAESYLFTVSAGDDRDISIIIGYDCGSVYGSVLLCRFHKMKPVLSNKLTARELLRQLTAQLKNGGIERRRRGGALGFVTYSDDLFQMLATPNSTPRCSKGAIFLRDKDDLKLHVFYFGTQDCAVKNLEYATPRKGGSFQMPASLIQQQLAIQTFFMVKPLAADILSRLNRFKICPLSVQQELSFASKARAYVDEQPDLGNRRKAAFYVFYSSNFIKCTLVRHAVGMHHDVFAAGKPSLENRMCFKCPLESNEKRATGTSRYGRGGAGVDYHCFAILDWPPRPPP